MEETQKLNIPLLLILSLCVSSLDLLLPFQDQVEPVPDDGHPEEPESRVSPQVEADWEQPEEGGVQISHSGRQSKQVLILAVLGLEMHRQFDPPAVEKFHDTTTSG